MDLADLPHSAILHVVVLGDADTPLVKLSSLSGLTENAPAAPRALAVRSHVHDGLQLHLVIQAAGLRKLGADGAQIGQYPILACERAAAIDLILAVVGEQIRRLCPHALVCVVAVDALQILDVVLIAQELYLLGQSGKSAGNGLKRGLGVPCGRWRRGTAWQRRLIEAERRQVTARPRAVLLGRRLVGRQAAENVLASIDVGVLRPTAGVGDDECLVPMQ